MENRTSRGISFPLGATVMPGGVNFSVFSKNCEYMELVFFDSEDATQPSRTIRLDPQENKTFYYWHVFVEGVRPGQLYGYRAHGQFAPLEGLRFDGSKVLIDPYARAIAGMKVYDREAARTQGDNAHCCLKSVVVDLASYDWEGDLPIRTSYQNSIIYELHVAGFTMDPESGLPENKRGTFAGLIEKIPYLQELGITEVELLPVQFFDAQDAPAGKTNYWGYSPIGFFAPHSPYSSERKPGAVVNEFRDMVKALHRAGIKVILDVVFNHTAEGNENGPTICFRGLENRAYYIPDPAQKGRYANYSGCGNTFNANQSITRRLILDSLRYWVEEMHVDGFRFDLASSLARDEEGQPLKNPPVLWEIESDPVLAGTRIIAEAWDAAGLYQLGTFVGHKWAEWNGRFRDDVRRFVKGDMDSVNPLMQRISGSRDLFTDSGREPERSINFVTCHDGFTLSDLVSYNQKHNESNGESNRDGMDENLSWNCGIEGNTTDPEILKLRMQQTKNFFVILFLAQGTPMMQMGDELGRSQNGNNNGYCNGTNGSWFPWANLASRSDLLNFVRTLSEFRKSRVAFSLSRFWADINAPRSIIKWSGTRLFHPDVAHHSHTLAFMLSPENDQAIFVILNAYSSELSFELPQPPASKTWRTLVDTARPNPPTPALEYSAAAHSSVILVSEANNHECRITFDRFSFAISTS